MFVNTDSPKPQVKTGTKICSYYCRDYIQAVNILILKINLKISVPNLRLYCNIICCHGYLETPEQALTLCST